MNYLLTRKNLDSSSNWVKKKLGLGQYWYWLEYADVEKKIDIWPLVFPLRYDVLIRKEFFRFYGENRLTFDRDFASFLRLAKQHAYYNWFSRVAVARFDKHLLADEAGLNRAFEERVKQSVKLYNAILKNGFDDRCPIIPYTGEEILPAETGRYTGEKYYMGDGCHRLACLMSLGYETLPRSYIRVKCFRRLAPLDNTRLLALSISIDGSWL